MAKKIIKPKIQPLAAHEAAHAVIAAALGQNLGSVRIKNGAGSFDCKRKRDESLRAADQKHDWLISDALIALAGEVGEEAILGTRTTNRADDQKRVYKVCHELGHAEEHHFELLTEFYRTTRQLVNEHREAIREVAVQLSEHGKLTGREVRRIIKGYDKDDDEFEFDRNSVGDGLVYASGQGVDRDLPFTSGEQQDPDLPFTAGGDEAPYYAGRSG